MSTTELERIVDEATAEERQFLFVRLSEKLRGHSQADMVEMDRRLADLNSGRKRLSLNEFEKRLNRPAGGAK